MEYTKEKFIQTAIKRFVVAIVVGAGLIISEILLRTVFTNVQYSIMDSTETLLIWFYFLPIIISAFVIIISAIMLTSSKFFKAQYEAEQEKIAKRKWNYDGFVITIVLFASIVILQTFIKNLNPSLETAFWIIVIITTNFYFWGLPFLNTKKQKATDVTIELNNSH